MATRSAIILVLVIVVLTPVAAQVSVGFGPLIGCYKAQNADGLRVSGGIGLRVRLSEIFRVEGSINYREEKYGEGSVEVKSCPIMVTGLLYPVPFVYGAIGAGWYNTFVSYEDPPGGLTGILRENKQQFGWHFGVGVELPVFSYVAVFGDIKYVFLNYDFKSLPGSSSVNSNSPVMTAGLLFRL